MSRPFPQWGRVVYRHHLLALVIALVLMAVTLVSLVIGGTLSSSTITRGDSAQAQALMDTELARIGGSQFTLIFSSSRHPVSDPRFRTAMLASLAPLRHDARVRDILTPYTAGIPAPEAASLVSTDKRAALAVITVADKVDKAREYYRTLRDQVRPTGLTVVGTGPAAIDSDYYTLLSSDLRRGESVSLPVTLLLLLLVFGTAVAAGLPLIVGGCAVVGGMGAVYLLSHMTDMSQYALNIVSLIGLGVAIDYSLFLVTRFREELGRGQTVEDALAMTMFATGRAVLFSGLTVAIGLSALLFFPGTPLPAMGLAGACVVLFALIYALVFLPSILASLGHRVNRWHVPLGPLARHPGHGEGFWFTVADWVMKRPVVVLVSAAIVILLLGSPFLSIHLAASDTSALPDGVEAYTGIRMLSQRFPDQGQTQIPVVVRFAGGRPLSAAHVGVLYDLAHRLERIPHVARVTGPVDTVPGLNRAGYQRLYSVPPQTLSPDLRLALRTSVGGDIAVLSVYTNQAVQSEAARTMVRAIRVLHPAAGTQILVGGRTAQDLDELGLILDRVPLALAYVVVVTLVVLFLLLGSVVLPFKAVLTDMLSISASFGALVWIFQEGHLHALLGFRPTWIDPIVPVLLFCVLFGLSMDYEVLLLTRMKDVWDRTGDNRLAVTQGLGRSGHLITGAAAIMVTVFLAFALASIVVLKALGLGMAIAVAVDATIVRTLIVPATMRLLGRANWWAPHPLARLHLRLHLRLGLHHSHAPYRLPVVPVVQEPDGTVALAGELS